MTSVEVQERSGITRPYDESYRSWWRMQISDQSPPSTQIVILGVEPSGKLPLHDRWWVTDVGGLDFGMSFESTGNDRISSIRQVDRDESKVKEAEIDNYIYFRTRTFKGQPLSHMSFIL